MVNLIMAKTVMDERGSSHVSRHTFTPQSSYQKFSHQTLPRRLIIFTLYPSCLLKSASPFSHNKAIAAQMQNKEPSTPEGFCSHTTVTRRLQESHLGNIISLPFFYIAIADIIGNYIHIVKFGCRPINYC